MILRLFVWRLIDIRAARKACHSLFDIRVAREACRSLLGAGNAWYRKPDEAERRNDRNIMREKVSDGTERKKLSDRQKKQIVWIRLVK